jgi:hypothetical protein
MPEVTVKVVYSVAGDLGLLRQSVAAMEASQTEGELDEIEDLLDRLEQKF